MADNDKETKTEPGERADHDLVSVYVSFNFAEAEFIRDMLLDNQIDTFLNKLESSPFPTDVGKTHQIRVNVDSNKVDQAAELLKEAIKEGALEEDDGEFMQDHHKF